MTRSTLLTSAALALMLAAPGLAIPTKKQIVAGMAVKWAPRVGSAAKAAARSQVNARRPTVLTMITTDSSLVDTDDSGDVTTGDMAIAAGNLLNERGERVGTWDGTFSHTSDESSVLVLTLRFSSYTVTISGAPFIQGSPFRDQNGDRFPAAPIVGSVGSSRYKGAAGFGLDDADNLVVLLPR